MFGEIYAVRYGKPAAGASGIIARSSSGVPRPLSALEPASANQGWGEPAIGQSVSGGQSRIGDRKLATADGRELFDSGEMRTDTPARRVSVPVAGVSELKVTILRQSRRLSGCWPLKGA